LEITIIFFLGLIVALVGVIPPGLLNMTAAKISLKEGPTRGVMFSIGVCIVVFAQTYVAAIFAHYLSNHPDVIAILQRVAFVLFVLITIYFFFIANKQKEKKVDQEIRSKGSRFFQGIFLSILNLLPIPYQSYMTITFASFGWLSFDKINVLSYVFGATTGTFVMLYIYMFFFDKIGEKPLTSQKNMNISIGVVTAIVAIVTLINIIKDL